MSNIFNKPSVVAVCADVNQGKSMLLYHLLEQLNAKHTYNLFTYGLRLLMKGSQEIFSVGEMETIRDSIIVVDELSSLFDLDNRKVKKAVENSLRLINHNNNVLVLCGVPENFKKFLSGKIDCIFYKKTTKADLINGCRVKNILESYRGNQNGSEVLNMAIDEALFFDGKHYSVVKVPYYKKYDSKCKNIKILQKKGKTSR
jgi:hypothetical protein